jgi:hypothetical protein
MLRPARFIARRKSGGLPETAGIIDSRTLFGLANAADPCAQADALAALLSLSYPGGVTDRACPFTVQTFPFASEDDA